MKRALPFSGFSNKKYVKNIYSLETIINAILYNYFDAYRLIVTSLPLKGQK